jgi:hypothetical protein
MRAVDPVIWGIAHRTTFRQIARGLARAGTGAGPKDQGFMNSIHVGDSLGLLIDLASHRRERPAGCRHAGAMIGAQRLRGARADSADGSPRTSF